jgi:hypothetical protein
MNTYELTEQIRKAETTKDGEAILIEALNHFGGINDMVVDNRTPNGRILKNGWNAKGWKV